MSFDARPGPPQKIAIIGGGISGLAAAYLLADQHDITLYEASPRMGGHARTVMAGKHGDTAVDTGFIVFNYVNYPHLTAMFTDLDVPVVKSDMSFGASINDGAIEYGLKDLPALLGQRRNLMRPGFVRMLRDIMRFNSNAEVAAQDQSLTIAELMRELRLGHWFSDYYLTPLCGAIWSTPVEEIAQYPASAVVRFFRNHALLSHTGQHQWWTVRGGSVEYVKRLTANLASRGVKLRPGSPVSGIQRNGVESVVHASGHPAETFDQIIMACHSDDALRLLDRPSKDEHRALSALRYQDNQMVLHADPGQMPKRRACWSSWVYRADLRRPGRGVGVTYWMNRLQSLPDHDPLFVTLNANDRIDPARIYDEKTFRHPVFDHDALRAQTALDALQGANNTWFAGAYLRHGFHEDGFASARRIARRMERQFA